MNRATQATAFLFLGLLGLWGCDQGPTASAQAERIKSLEAKTARLEADFRAAAATRDQLRQELDEAKAIVKERDNLRAQVKQRISERDQVVAQYDTFRKSIRDLVGQAESTVLRFPNNDPVTVTVARQHADQHN